MCKRAPHPQWESLFCINFHYFHGRISADSVNVGRVLYCRVGGHGFDFWGRNNTLGLKITEKWMYYCLYLAND